MDINTENRYHRKIETLETEIESLKEILNKKNKEIEKLKNQLSKKQ